MNFKDYVLLYNVFTEEQIRSTLEILQKDDQDFIRLYLVDALVSYSQTDLLKKNLNIFV